MEKDKFKDLRHPQSSLLSSLKLSNAFNNNSSRSSSRDDLRGIVSSEDERDQMMRKTLEDYQYNPKLANQQGQILHLQTIAQSPLQSIFHPNTIQPVSSSNSQTSGQLLNQTIHQYTHKRTTPPLFPMQSMSSENNNTNNAKQQILQLQLLKQHQQQSNIRPKNSIAVKTATAVGSNNNANQPTAGTYIKTNAFDLERIQISEDSYLRQHSQQQQQQQQQQLYSTSSSQYSSLSASFRKGHRGSSSEESKHSPIQQYQQYQQLPKEQYYQKQLDLPPSQPSSESVQPRSRISRSDAKEQPKLTEQQILAPSSMQVVSSFTRRRSSSGIQINPPCLKVISKECKVIQPEKQSPLVPYNSHTNNHQIRTKSSPFLAGTSQVNSHQTTPSPVRKDNSPLRTSSPIIATIRRNTSPNQTSETPQHNSRTSTPAKKPNGLLISNKESSVVVVPTAAVTTETPIVTSQQDNSLQHSPEQQKQNVYEKLQTSYNLLEKQYKDILEELSRVRAEQQITIEEKNKQLGRALQELEKLLLDNTTISERCYTAQESLKLKLTEISQMKQQHFDDIQNLRKAAKQEVTRLVDEEVKRMVGPLIKENTRLEIELSRIQEQFTLSQRRDIQFQEEKQQQQQQQSIFSEDDSSQIYAINNTRAYKINEELSRANELLMREKEELKNESDKWREKYAAICEEMSGIREQFLQYMKVIEEIKKYKQIEESTNMKNNLENGQQQQQQWYQQVVQQEQNQQKGYQQQPSQLVLQHQQQQQLVYLYDAQTTLTTDTFDGDEQFEQEIRREILTGLKSTNPGNYIFVDQRDNDINHAGKINSGGVSNSQNTKNQENNLINISNCSHGSNLNNSGKKLHKRLKSSETNELKLIGWDKMSEEQEIIDTNKQQVISNHAEISMIKSAQQQCKTLGDEFSFTAQDDQVAEDALSLRKYEEEFISQELQQQQEQQLQKQQQYTNDSVFERQQEEKAIIDHTTFKEQFPPRILNNVACIESLQIGQDQQTQATKDNNLHHESTPNPTNFNNNNNSSSGYQSTEKSTGYLSSNKEQQREGSNSKVNAINYNSLSKNSNNINIYSSNSKNNTNNNNNNINGTVSTLLNSVQSLRKLTNQGIVPEQPTTQNIEDKNKYSDGNIHINNNINSNSHEIVADIKGAQQTQDFDELRKRYQQTVQALLGLKAGRINNSTMLNLSQNQQVTQATATKNTQEFI